ncbi:hypothetical protein FLG15_21290 [Xanthomonas phaseoli pv. dieffenbachiae]|uniref:Uncharacterized protein n=1 Tax=Xanthomonas phaseoli pv. dieffenbachiae TaxID=92828 RepID=A0A1V9H915_9XANT|nr:hypothetical protein IM53_010245 [Xanthomonas phaseoli pv. dieffenbachiae]
MESSQKAPVRDMAVLCSLAELPDGSLRVILDDVRKGHGPGTWVSESLFTFNDYPSGCLSDLASVPEAELADVGYNVLARLLANNRLGT